MTRWLDLDPHGRVVPESPEARSALADLAGRFELLPGTPDLLVARRVPASGASAPPPRVVFCGDLSGFPIADFIAFVHQARLSGVLHVASADSERAVKFREGQVRSARSSVTGERIGEVAVRLGYVSEEHLEQVLGSQSPMGQTLVRRGYISPNDLWKCFHEQVTAVFHALLLSRAGVFWMVDAPVTERPGASLSVNTQALLMDGIRRIDELSLFRARIPGPGAFLRRREPKRPVSLQPVEQRLLALVDGRRTVAAVATAARLSEFDATKILYHLAEAGYVEAVDEPAVAPLSDAGERLTALIEAYDELYRLVVTALPEAARAPFLAAVGARLMDRSAPYAPLFAGLGPSPAGDLEQARLLDNMRAMALGDGADDGSARLLDEGLRELLFFFLFLAGERLPAEADERLGEQVRRKLTALEGLVRG